MKRAASTESRQPTSKKLHGLYKSMRQAAALTLLNDEYGRPRASAAMQICAIAAARTPPGGNPAKAT